MNLLPGSRRPALAASRAGGAHDPARSLTLLAVALSSCVMLTPFAARAQESGGAEEAPRQAIELFQRARESYQSGRYQAAATDLEEALTLDPDSPTLLYNLARVYELWGEHDRAIQTYQRYLAVVPADDAAERERTEAAIQRLQGAREYVRPDEDVYSQPIYVSQRGVADELFWATLVSGAVITLGAAGLAVGTSLAYDDATRFRIGDAGGTNERDQRFDDAATLALATDIVGAVGGATLLAAGLLWVLRERTVELYPSSAPVSVDLAPDLRGGAVVTLRGAF